MHGSSVISFIYILLMMMMGQTIIEYGSAIDKYVCKDDTLKKVDIKSVIFTIRT